MSRKWGDVIDIDGPGGRSVRLPPIGRPPSGAVRAAAAAILLLLLLFTGYYQIEPAEVGVIQRFGAHVRTTGPGPHLKIPLGIETLTKVPVQRQLKMEFGFRTMRGGVRSEFVPLTPEIAAESIMLTGDLYVAVVEWMWAEGATGRGARPPARRDVFSRL